MIDWNKKDFSPKLPLMSKEEAKAKWAQLYNFDEENRWIIIDLKRE